jgi:hypothetical protein
MTVNKQFAQYGVALEDCMPQLVEVLTQLLDERPTPAVAASDPGAAPTIGPLLSGDNRVIHVVVNK